MAKTQRELIGKEIFQFLHRTKKFDEDYAAYIGFCVLGVILGTFVGKKKLKEIFEQILLRLDEEEKEK